MSLYLPVKYALMIILLIGLVVVVLALAPELSKQRSNSNYVAQLAIQLIILTIGFLGAYRDDRRLLVLFAIIMSILVIIAVVQSQQIMVVGNAVLDIISIVLAVYQSEMIRGGL